MKPLFIGDHEVVEDDVLEADDGFTCMDPGDHLTVHKDPETGELFVRCGLGDHSLDGQRSGEQLVGFRLVEGDE